MSGSPQNFSQKTIAGRYELAKCLASGKMSDVYLAHDKELGRQVAVKVLSKALATQDEFVRKFQLEAQAVAGLSHPNLVAVYDLGSEFEGSDLQDNDFQGSAKIYFIVMEHIDGPTLAQLLKQKGAFLPDEILRISFEIAKGLDFAHVHNIVHQDIKPSNILLFESNGGSSENSGEDSENRNRTNREVKIADFGIAYFSMMEKAQQQNLNQAVAGTAAYLSPEQARGETVDARSDLYSLGIMMYEMQSGKVPFSGKDSLEVAKKHIIERPAFSNGFPASLKSIISKLLEKNPANRFQSSQELMDALRKNSPKKIQQQ